MPMSGRTHLRRAVRGGAVGFVVVWLFVDDLQQTFPFWLPFCILAAVEAEFVVRGLHERSRAPETAEALLERRRPGSADADLGWEDDETGDARPPVSRGPATRRRGAGWLAYALGAAVVAALFVVAWRIDARDSWSSLSEAERARTEQLATAEAARIAARPVVVRCDEAYAFTGPGADASGVAFLGRSLALLDPAVCRRLHDLAFGGDTGAIDDTAWALTVLAHEATHLRGVRDEGVTECFAVQEAVALGVRLGLPRADAARLARFQLDRALSDRALGRLPYALPEECRDRGRLDLRPGDSLFP